MANGKKTLKKCTLSSEEILDRKGVRWFIIIFHMLALVLGIIAIIIGVLSYTQGIDGSSTVPQTNCTLAITISDTGGAEFPLRLLLLLSGIILILVDLGISGLLCVIKYQSCGVLAAAWFLIMVVCTATWTAWSIAFIVVVFPNWLADRALCDNLVMIVTVVMTAFCGLTTLVYVVVIFIVIAFDCHRWRNMKSF